MKWGKEKIEEEMIKEVEESTLPVFLNF